MRQIDIAPANTVSRRVEDVAVALLDGYRQLLLGAGFKLADLVLLVLREIHQSFGLLEILQRQPPLRFAPHFLLAGIVRGQENQIIAQRPQGRAFRALPRMDARDRLGNALDGATDGDAVVGKHNQPWATVADLVRHVEGGRRGRGSPRRSRQRHR